MLFQRPYRQDHCGVSLVDVTHLHPGHLGDIALDGGH
jgi:hypothetical protein